MAKIETLTGIPDDDFHREGLIDRLAQYVAADPGAWNVRYNLGVALLEDGHIDDALEQFRQVLAVSPKHMETMINIAGIHFSKGEPDQALKILASALQVWDTPVVRANLGLAYLQVGHLDQAEEHLKTALANADNMPDAWCNLSMVCLRQGNPEDAVKAAERALKLHPDFAVAHNNMAVACLELGETEKAREHALKARELEYELHPDLVRDLGI